MGAEVVQRDDWIEVRSPGVDSTAPTASGRARSTSHFNAIPDAAMTAAVLALFARRAVHAAQHRQLARQGDRPHRRDGDRAREVRRDGGGRARLAARRAAVAGRRRATRRGRGARRAGRDRHLRRPPDGDVLFADALPRRAGAHRGPGLRRARRSPTISSASKRSSPASTPTWRRRHERRAGHHDRRADGVRQGQRRRRRRVGARLPLSRQRRAVPADGARRATCTASISTARPTSRRARSRSSRRSPRAASSSTRAT